jgi:hypothetical protein
VAIQTTTRNPSTNAASIAPRALRSLTCAPANFARCSLIVSRTCGGSGVDARRRSSERLNAIESTSPSAATASNPAMRDTALFTPDATPACS